MFTLPAGKLRSVITIQGKTQTESPEYGGTETTWANLHTGIRAQKLPLSGKEVFAAKAAQSVAHVKFRFRYLSDVTATMRIVESGVVYEIVTPPIDLDGMGRWMEAITKSTVSGE